MYITLFLYILIVGKEKFMQDCGDVMRLLLASQTGQELADDDPQVGRPHANCVCALCCRLIICHDLENPIFSDFLT